MSTNKGRSVAAVKKNYMKEAYVKFNDGRIYHRVESDNTISGESRNLFLTNYNLDCKEIFKNYYHPILDPQYSTPSE